VQLVTRALDVLKAVGSAENGVSLQELSRTLAIPPGSMHRLLAVLEGEQFLSRSPTTRKYFVGPSLRAVCSRVDRPSGNLTAPHAALAELAGECSETVFLTEIIGRRAICTSLAYGANPLRLFVQVGQEMPLHAAASARVLLADLDRREAVSLMQCEVLTRYTDRTPNTVQDVLAQLPTIAERGYDICDDELDDGVWAVASPVRSGSGEVCASVTLAAPTHRVDPARARELRTKVMRAASRMALDLGWTEPFSERPLRPVPAADRRDPLANRLRRAPERVGLAR
jgi:DNA-binding IclR family transcriptional regulator